MTQLFLPIAVAKIVLQCITSLVSYGLLAFFSNAPVAVTMIVYEINFMFYFEPIIIAFLLVYGSGQMKKFVCCGNNCSSRVAVALNDNHDMDDHFNRLNDIFAK
uniref:Uncharacterized protein n=1 Tax=Ditylenchus dipsaci TaxID=166011 RepID=A0A915EC08_9BILA